MEKEKQKEHMKIVIVGHVDHGKSTLIGRLLYDTSSLPDGFIEEIKKTCEMLGRELEFAYVLDSLEEEREQNITITTTKTFFKTKKREYVIIDAPGHKEFVKNMITGASLAEAAILIVSAKEGVQEQTKRHAYILSMLGIKQVIVAVNKIDLIGYKEEIFNSVKEELLKFLDSVKIKPSYVIPISAKEGDNITKKSEKIRWYSSLTVLEALDAFETEKKAANKPLRLPVQDVYKIDDKRIIAGRIESGKIKKGDNIIFLPSDKEAVVKSVEAFNEDREEAEAGESIGITTEEELFIERGQVICHKDRLPKVKDRFKANIFWMSDKQFDINEKITIKCATQEAECFIEKIEKRINSSDLEVIEENAKKLEHTELGSVIIKTKEPLVIENFNDMAELGRFVFVKGYDTVAGGIITEND